MPTIGVAMETAIRSTGDLLVEIHQTIFDHFWKAGAALKLRCRVADFVIPGSEDDPKSRC